MINNLIYNPVLAFLGRAFILFVCFSVTAKIFKKLQGNAVEDIELIKFQLERLIVLEKINSKEIIDLPHITWVKINDGHYDAPLTELVAPGHHMFEDPSFVDFFREQVKEMNPMISNAFEKMKKSNEFNTVLVNSIQFSTKMNTILLRVKNKNFEEKQYILTVILPIVE